MDERMTIEQVQDVLRQAGTDKHAIGSSMASLLADAIDAHLAQPAQAVDVVAIREVIATLRACTNNDATTYMADKLTRAIGNAQAEVCIPVPRSLIERWANVDAFNAPVGAAMELRTIADEMLLYADKRDFYAQTQPTQATPNAHE